METQQPTRQATQPGQQQLDVKELFAMIGELNVQLRVANQMIMGLQQEKTKLEEGLKKVKN